MIFWFRRDLRLKDNHGLYEALKSDSKVLPIFIFDENILNQLENKSDRRVDFIVEALQTLNSFLKTKGKAIKIYICKPLEIYQKLIDEYEISAVYSNEDYDRMHQKLTQNEKYAKKMSRIRSKTVEPVIGTLVNFTNMKRVNTRGIKNANKHVMMATLTYNLKKYMRFTIKKPSILAQVLSLKQEELCFCKNSLFKLQ